MTYRLFAQSGIGLAILASGVYVTGLGWPASGSLIEMLGVQLVAFAIYDFMTKGWKP